jgi:hypothetical protein
MKIIDYGTPYMNEDLEPAMVIAVEVPLMINFFIPDEFRHELEEFFRIEREKKKNGQSA